eukprot:4778546-Prymnesium_polylepis.2
MEAARAVQLFAPTCSRVHSVWPAATCSGRSSGWPTRKWKRNRRPHEAGAALSLIHISEPTRRS